MQQNSSTVLIPQVMPERAEGGMQAHSYICRYVHTHTHAAGNQTSGVPWISSSTLAGELSHSAIKMHTSLSAAKINCIQEAQRQTLCAHQEVNQSLHPYLCLSLSIAMLNVDGNIFTKCTCLMSNCIHLRFLILFQYVFYTWMNVYWL